MTRYFPALPVGDSRQFPPDECQIYADSVILRDIISWWHVKIKKTFYVSAVRSLWFITFLQICVPRSGCNGKNAYTDIDFQNHVLLPVDEEGNKYRTVHGKVSLPSFLSSPSKNLTCDTSQIFISICMWHIVLRIWENEADFLKKNFQFLMFVYSGSLLDVQFGLGVSSLCDMQFVSTGVCPSFYFTLCSSKGFDLHL